MVIEGLRKLYNEARPHSSLGKMTPGAYARMVGNTTTQGPTLKN
ncbi:integrase core domain-containing protein [Solidesulfovibrio carbinolicus]